MSTTTNTAPSAYEREGTLYPIFTNVIKTITGKDPANFDFVIGKTPLSTFKEVSIGFCIYYLVIFTLYRFMKNRKPMKFKYIALVHNVFLCLMSLTLVICMGEFVFPIWKQDGLYAILCSPKAYTQKLMFLYYCNYLVKYYEFIDTVFLALKKKKLDFLHLYHHGMTMFICWCELYGNATVTWCPVMINLLVHVFMYYYYARTTLIKKRVWWKQHLTTLQIVQFVIDIVFIYSCTYTYFAYNFYPFLPNFGNCHGEPTMAVIGCVVITSYLFLFIDFFKKTYKGLTTKKSTATKKNEKATVTKTSSAPAATNIKKRAKSAKIN